MGWPGRRRASARRTLGTSRSRTAVLGRERDRGEALARLRPPPGGEDGELSTSIGFAEATGQLLMPAVPDFEVVFGARGDTFLGSGMARSVQYGPALGAAWIHARLDATRTASGPRSQAPADMLPLLLPALRADLELVLRHRHRSEAPLGCPIVCLLGAADRLIDRPTWPDGSATPTRNSRCAACPAGTGSIVTLRSRGGRRSPPRWWRHERLTPRRNRAFLRVLRLRPGASRLLTNRSVSMSHGGSRGRLVRSGAAVCVQGGSHEIAAGTSH